MFWTSDNHLGDVLIIKPNGTYELLYKKSGKVVEIDLTDSGWYYISFLDSPIVSQQAWAIISIYENNDLPIKYIKILDTYRPIGAHQYAEVYYNNKFKTNNTFELFGIITGGGHIAWPLAGKTEDKVEVILSDGSYKQLYQDIYNGKVIFKDRTITDFANGTFNTIRSHNIRGGELDIFYEELGNDYFNGNSVLGYRVTKMGNNSIILQLVGLSQEIYSPEFSIEIEKNINNLVENENIHIKTNITNIAEFEESIGYNTKIVCKIDEVLSNIKNIVVKINGEEANVNATYDSITNQVTIDEIDKILPSEVVTIEFDTAVNSNIQNKGEVNSNVELPISVNIKSYSMDIDSLEEAEKEKYENLYIEEEATVNITGVYKEASEGVEVRYIDQVSREEIILENISGFKRDEYQTELKEIEGYEIENIPENAIGIMTEEKIIVIYEYKKVSKLITKYIDEVTGSEIENTKEERTYKENEKYDTEKKEISGYRYTRDSKNTNGIVGRSDIEIVYYYKKISEGVEVKYVDQVTGEEIENTEIIEGLEKDKYEAEEKEIEGYELVNSPANARGEMTVEKIIVTYEYRRKGKVIVKYIDKEKDEIIKEEIIEGIEGDKYKVEREELEKYNYIETVGEEEGEITVEEREVKYYYTKKEAIVEVVYVDEKGNEIYKEIIEGKVGEKYRVEENVPKNYKIKEEAKNKEGIFEVEEIKVKYIVERIKSSIVINIVDENGKVIEKIEKEGDSGEIYEIELPKIEGYYTEKEKIEVECGKEEVINVEYKKITMPNTSDVNIFVYVTIFFIAIVGVIIGIIFIKNKKK